MLSRLKGALEPFLLIEAIETTLREVFGRVFGEDLPERLAETFDEDHPLSTPASVEHCSSAHYAQFLSVHWEEFEPIFDDRQDVIRELVSEIGDMRNQLFHFRVDGVGVRPGPAPLRAFVFLVGVIGLRSMSWVRIEDTEFLRSTDASRGQLPSWGRPIGGQ